MPLSWALYRLRYFLKHICIDEKEEEAVAEEEENEERKATYLIHPLVQ